jgi:hypothetical protein
LQLTLPCSSATKCSSVLTQGLLGRYDLLSLVASRILPTKGSTAIILPCSTHAKTRPFVLRQPAAVCAGMPYSCNGCKLLGRYSSMLAELSPCCTGWSACASMINVHCLPHLLIGVSNDGLDIQVVVPQRLIARQRQAAQPSEEDDRTT